MSIQVNNLTKVYGKQKAVDNISFEVNEGEIAGFLGPNGAGKSTTMKIATTYLPPTSGSVRVSGFDVQAEPISVKKIIGYLPEHNPLYLDMYVHEYLKFIAKLHQIKGKKLKSRIEEMISLCGLTREQNKLIGSLSKGYRQRIGLAQALIHDPKVLILDEPTTGLDPNQIIEIRNMIRDISKNKTVLFSTHIMQEVQAICDRAVIINKGKIVADDKLENLSVMKKGQTRISIEFENDINENILSNIEGVNDVQSLGRGKYLLISDSGEDIRSKISKVVLNNDLDLVGLNIKQESIEEVFQQLTRTEEETNHDTST